MFKSFLRISEAETLFVLKMRNSERVRTRMLNSNVITLDEHMRWIASLGKNSDCSYFLVCDNGVPIGVVDFTSINWERKEAFWGFYLIKGNRPGFGAVGFLALDHCFDAWDFSLLRSYVLKSNPRSCDWHVKLLFSREAAAEGQDHPYRFALARSDWIAGRDAIRETMFAKCVPAEVVWSE
jgi:UDP-4-amino-4,6-dideoxy-N-acetyl-beta-L-altrosamine N-acetyltransferase